MRRAIRKHLGDFVALLLLAAVATGVGAYILANQRLRFPLVEEAPVVLHLELADAQAVIPGQGQTVRVAGVRVGSIGGVRLREGRALVEMELDPRHRRLVRRDATALLRPKTGLKDMFVELDPGSRDAPPLRPGGVVPVANTAPDVDPDEFLAVLDRDTRDYLKLLISGAGKGLAGRGDDLREAFARLGPLHRDLADVTEAIAERRRSLRRVVRNYSALVDELADEDGELSRLVTASSQVFGALAPEGERISETVARLPSALTTTERTLGKVERLGEELGPSLSALRPAVRALDTANAELLPFGRQAAPLLERDIRPFVRAAGPYLGEVEPAARELATASPDLTKAFFRLNRFFNLAAHNPGGRERLTGDRARDLARDEGYLFWLGWVAQLTTSVFNTADASGVMRRGQFTVSCDTLRDSIAGEAPALVELLGYAPALSDPRICGRSAP